LPSGQYMSCKGVEIPSMSLLVKFAFKRAV
jgi:hypothetical protein